jgi:hypothetical protein
MGRVPRTRRRTRTLLAGLAAGLAATAGCGGSSTREAPATTRAPVGTPPASDVRPFAADSVFNQALRDDAPLASRSAAWAGFLRRSVAEHGTWINSSTCAMPIYRAPAGTPRTRVVLDPGVYQDPALLRAWASVPIPADADVARCPDANLAVLQRQPDGAVTQWELWSARREDGRWTAKWGGVTQDVARDRGVASAYAWSDPGAPDPAARRSTWAWNVSASSLSMTAGVITRADLARGSIDHAVALAVNDAAAIAHLWPAQRTDGTSQDPDAIPEGAHLRLPADLDLSRRPMSPLVRMIAVAAQRYGVVVRDKSYGVNAFVAEQMPQGADPVPALLDGSDPATALRAFPWSELEVLDAPVCRDFGPCRNTDETRIAVDGEPRVGEALRLDARNSTFDLPRTAVRWDVGGDGEVVADGPLAPTARWTPATAGRRTVVLTTRLQDGSVHRGEVRVDVRP